MCLNERKGALFIALREGQICPFPTKPLQRFISNRNRPTVRGGFLSAVVLFWFGSGWRSGYDPLYPIPVRPGSKRIGPGREPEPEPGAGAHMWA